MASQAQSTELWDLWYPQAGAVGLPFARGRIAAGAEQLLVHAAPKVLEVQVVVDGRVVAEGKELKATADTPVARLTRRGDRIERADIWPGQAELGKLVILCGGEVGTLTAWWHAEDHSEWRWSIELYNRQG